MKVIYKDSVIKAIEELQDCYNGFSDTYDKACIIGVIEEIPVVDAVEVVRCKDCRHKNNSRIVFGTYGQHLHHCNELNQIVSDDFFCANAERRTG